MPQTRVLVPLLNTNEPEARLVEIHARDGQRVQKGDLLFTIETTKAASDVESPEAGFVRLVVEEGTTLAVGDTLAFITPSPDEALPEPQAATATAAASQPAQASPGALRITKPARALAESLGLDLASLPTDRLITEGIIRQAAASQSQSSPVVVSNFQPALVDQKAEILLYGAGGHAKAVLEMIQAVGAFRLAGILDDNPALEGALVLGVPVLGGQEKLPELRSRGILLAANGVGGIINIDVRGRIFERLAAAGFAFPILRHPRATLEPSAQIFDGVQVFANAYIGSSAILRPRCMINTGAIVSHDCEIGMYAHIAPGAMLAGHVSVGDKALVGMGVTTAIGISIGAGARIGNGATLLADVPPRAIIQAGKVWTGPAAV
jgi:sugar O-acyltransferase (sialic acid O-acetyltransferase NeuD family)